MVVNEDKLNIVPQDPVNFNGSTLGEPNLMVHWIMGHPILTFTWLTMAKPRLYL